MIEANDDKWSMFGLVDEVMPTGTASVLLPLALILWILPTLVLATAMVAMVVSQEEKVEMATMTEESENPGTGERWRDSMRD